MTEQEGHQLERIYERLGELESGQKVMIAQGERVANLLECHDGELFGGGANVGLRTRLDRLEQAAHARERDGELSRKQLYAIWGAIVSVIATGAAAAVAWLLDRRP